MIEVSKAAVIAAYELLRTQRPFLSWKLPDSAELEFVITSARHYADCLDGRIRVSRACHGQLNTLLMTVAHEAIHLHQQRKKLETPNTEHNADFRKRAARVCRIHGFDPKVF